MVGAMPSSTCPWLDPLAGPCGGTHGSKGQREPDTRELAGALGGNGGKYGEARLENLGELAAMGSPRAAQVIWD
jgi:hypothetical protein